MGGEDFFKRFGRIMEREADALHQPLILFFQRKAPCVHGVGSFEVFAAERMQQIVIKIACPCLFKLLVEQAVKVGGFLCKPNRHFVRKQEAFTRVALHKRFPHGKLGFIIMVSICGIEISETRGQKAVEKLFRFLQVNLPMCHRQAHRAKTKLLHMRTSVKIQDISST